MKNKIAVLFFCIIELFFRSNNVDKIKIDDFPELDDFMYVDPEELNDLLDFSSTAWDDAIKQPHVIKNVRNYFETCYENSIPPPYDDPLW